jgi:hypothetical protein
MTNNEQGLFGADNNTAEDLYEKHKLYSAALKHAKDIRNRAKIAGDEVAEARANGSLKDISYETAELAGSSPTQQNMLRYAQLLYDANL